MDKVSTRDITLCYILALGLVAMLSIAAYFTLNRVVVSQKTSAAQINISGSLRWLSQRASAYSLRLINSHSRGTRERYRRELLHIANRMKKVRGGLIGGDLNMNLSGNPSPQVRAIYFDPPMLLDKQIHSYITAVNALAHDPDNKLTRNNPHLRYILDASTSKLLGSLDALVKQHQTECEENNARLQRTEVSVLGFTLVVLLMEALFVFRPMVCRVKQDSLKLVNSETRTRLIIDNAWDGIITVDEYGIVESFNQAAEKIFGYTSTETQGKNVRLFMPGFYYTHFHDSMHAKKKGAVGTGAYETIGRRKDHTAFPMSISISELLPGGQQLFIMLVRDITERKWTEEKLRKLSRAVEQSPATVVITDRKGNIEYVNPKFAQITGYSPEEAIGKNPRILKSGEIPPEEYKRLWDTITSGGEWRGIFHNKKKSGDSYWESASISAIKNWKGAITHFIAVKEDITERKQFESRLEFLADHDPLTNLFNRRRFQKEFEGWLVYAQRYGNYGALLFLDVDNFKYINDTLGHHEGDILLTTLADLMRKRLRETDILARLGGDEFAILLPNVDSHHAQSITEEIMESVRHHVPGLNKHSVGVTVSIGIALFPEHGDTAKSLFACADLAMYQAKEDGRNRICIYTPHQKTKIELRLSWEERIRNAINHDRFVLHAQPILDLRHNRVAGYEALLRMVDKDGEIIPPADFLDIAERFGLIHEIDRWVVRRAIRLIAEQKMANNNLYLEVNLSGKTFADTELLPLINRELSIHTVNPRNLVLEITETAIIANMIEARHFITTLKSMGCRFALDDFGRGFSSFDYLKHLPVDYIKIDGSFIRNLPQDTVDQHLVKAIVEMAHGLGKQIIAEFVSNEATVQLLREYGVDYAQGHYIGMPGERIEVA